MNELQLKLAKRRQAMGDESVVESTTDTKSTVSPPSPSKLSLRTSMNDKPSPASSGIKSTSSSNSTPIKDSIKVFEKSKSSNLDKETTPTGNNTNDTSNNNSKSHQKPTPGKLKQFGLGLGINMNAFNPNAPRPSFAAKPSSSSSNTEDTQSSHHLATGEVKSTAEREVPKPEMKHPTMKRPMVDKQMRRLSSVKKMDLKVLNHDDGMINMTDDSDHNNHYHGSVDVDNDGSEGRKSATVSTFTPVLETIRSSTDESNSIPTKMEVTDTSPVINIISNNASVTTAATTTEDKVVNDNKVGTATTTKVNFDEKSIDEQHQQQHDEDGVAVDHRHNTNNLIRLNSTLTSYDSFKTAHDSESVKQYNENEDYGVDADVKELKRENKRLIAEVESLKNELYQRDVRIISLEDEILFLKQRERMREEKSLLSTPTHKRAHYNNDNDNDNDVGSATPEHKRGFGVNRGFNSSIGNDDSFDGDGSTDMYADSKHTSYTSSGINSGRLGTSRSDTSRCSNNNNNNNNNNSSGVMATVSEEKLNSRRSSSSSTTSKEIDDDNSNSKTLNKSITTGAAEYNNFGFNKYEDVITYFAKPTVTSAAPVDSSAAAAVSSTMEKLQAHKLNIMSAMSFTVDDDDDDTAVDSNNIESSGAAVDGNDNTVKPPTTSSSTPPVVVTVSEADYQAFITKLHHKDSAALMFFIKRFLSSVLGSSASGSISGNVSRDNSRPSSPSKNNSNNISGNNNTDFSLSSPFSPSSPTAAAATAQSVNNSMRRSSSVFVGTTDLDTRYSDFIDTMMTHFKTHTFWRDHSNNDAHNNVIDNNNSDAASYSITTEHKSNNSNVIQYCLEKYLMSHIYDVSWKYIKQQQPILQQHDTADDEDVVLLNQIQQLSFLAPAMLNIKPATLTRLQQPQQQFLIQSAIQSFIVLNEYKTPTDKAQCLIKCISTVYQLLYPKATDNQSDDKTNKNDEFMSLFLYVIIHSKASDLMTNQKWMSAFYHKSTSTSGGHSTSMNASVDSTGYCLNQLKLVTDFLLKLSGATNIDLSLSQLEPYINLDSQEKNDEFKTM